MGPIIKALLWISYAISLYCAVFILLQVIKNKYTPGVRKLHGLPKVTITVPAHNEEKTIVATLRSLDRLNYPKGRLQVFVVNDGSTDATRALAREYAKDKSYIRVITKKNRAGKAAALNTALAITKSPFFVCLDADSEVHPDILKNMLSYFDDDVALVTPAMRVNGPQTFMQRLQRAEYLVQVLLARLISGLDCQYVAPGPFSVYRTGVLEGLGGFDEKNITEDQEIGYRHQLHHYRIRHCHEGLVFTNAPATLHAWYRQRRRWFRGGLDTLLQYRSMLLNKEYGDFGYMQMLQNLVRMGLCVLTIIITWSVIIHPWWKKMRDLLLIRFDVLPSLHTLTLKYDLVNIGTAQLAVLTAILTITLFLFWQAHREMNENVMSHGFFVIIPYFFVYYLLNSIVMCIVILQAILGVRKQW